VVTRYRDTNQNLRTQLLRIIKRAGLKHWPKLFQNLRAIRETELRRSHPTHVVCAWIGNSPKVAAKNYLQVTEEDSANATAIGGGGAESGARPHPGTLASVRRPHEMQAFANVYECPVAEAGLEPARGVCPTGF
jgi:hypothetical protein